MRIARLLVGVSFTVWGLFRPACAAAAEPDARESAAATDLYGDPLPKGAILRLGTTRFHHQSFIQDAAFSPDGRILASAAANQDVGIALWEIPSGRLLRRLIPAGARPAWTRAVAFSPDGKKLLTGDVGGMVHLWDVASGDQIYSIEAYRGKLGATAIAFSRDGHWIASGGSEGVVRLWSGEGGRELLSFDTPQQSQSKPLAHV